MRTRDKKSFPHYEGTILQWKSKRWENNKLVYVKVAAMDFHIGYTLVNAEDPTDNFTCVHGPLSKTPRRYHPDRYEQKFGYLLDCIRNKKIYDVSNGPWSHVEEEQLFGNLGSCSFSI